MTIDTQKLRDQAQDAIAEALGDAYDCLRCWSAWGVGTMRSDDFALVTDDSDRLAEITDAALSPVLPIIDALEADNKRLRVALTTIKEWPITSPLNMDAHNMQVVAHAALAQEQGGSDADTRRNNAASNRRA